MDTAKGNSKTIKIFAAVLFTIAIIILPHFAGEYYTTLAIKVYIMALLACSFNLLLGYTGILSFGQAAYYGIGAYTCALVLKGAVPNIWLGLLAAMVASGIIAFIFGSLCLRLTEAGHTVYFAMLTLAFGQIVYTVAFKWESVTGGDNGMAGIPAPNINLGFVTLHLDNVYHFYFFAIVIIAVALAILYLLVHSSFGATLQAIRENHERAKFMGQNIRTFQVISFTVAGIFCGLAGGIFVAIEKFVSPELVYWSKSAEIIMVSILGGIYTFVGPLVGAAVMLLIEDYLSSYTSYWSVFLGSVLIIFVLFMPDGIVGQLQQLKQRYSKTRIDTRLCRSDE
ncbi:MAG: branched-chain amino acid ABC transporter permease [Pseudomonadota bacterium]